MNSYFIIFRLEIEQNNPKASRSQFKVIPSIISATSVLGLR